MWQVANPVYWWAAGALVLPIVIHLYNQRSSKVKRLGSLRWLEEVQPAQANFRRIQQWPLLLLRLLLLFLVVLLLIDLFQVTPARPVSNRQALILIHPEAGDSVRLQQLAQQWQNDSVHVHWLAPGFPGFADSLPKAAGLVWSLVAEAAQRFPTDSIHFLAPDRADYLALPSPTLAIPVSWELTKTNKDTTRLLQAVGNVREPELLWFRSGSDFTGTFWTTRAGNAQLMPEGNLIRVGSGSNSYTVPVQNPDTLKVAAAFASGQEEEWNMLRTALQALAAYHRVPMRLTENHKEADWFIAMNSRKAPDPSDFISLVIQYQPLPGSDWLEPVTSDSLLIRKKLTTQNILEGGLLQALRPYVLAFKARHAVSPTIDLRKTDLMKRTTKQATLARITAEELSVHSLRVWLGIGLLTLLAIERLWPKQLS